ncbi:hypothetical protein BpHYR1_013582 [Brachionus plicatilis]|uniref:Uncharacterized protein n=1 Tax=Brachionus plicatilis TaxID=10195 RepID=A0A3M7QNR6_BRAPC|nr:hypothetical protein BpHYR1_013582 [Brachionus plicatilis]
MLNFIRDKIQVSILSKKQIIFDLERATWTSLNIKSKHHELIFSKFIAFIILIIEPMTKSNKYLHQIFNSHSTKLK